MHADSVKGKRLMFRLCLFHRWLLERSAFDLIWTTNIELKMHADFLDLYLIEMIIKWHYLLSSMSFAVDYPVFDFGNIFCRWESFWPWSQSKIEKCWSNVSWHCRPGISCWCGQAIMCTTFGRIDYSKSSWTTCDSQGWWSKFCVQVNTIPSFNWLFLVDKNHIDCSCTICVDKPSTFVLSDILIFKKIFTTSSVWLRFDDALSLYFS